MNTTKLSDKSHELRWDFQTYCADVFNLRSFDLNPRPQLVASLYPVLFSSMYSKFFATQITDCYWPEKCFVSLIGFR